MLMDLVIFLGLMLILTLALMDTAGMRSRKEEECMRKEERYMSEYNCGSPEWVYNEECPLETGKVQDCFECYWGKKEENE